MEKYLIILILMFFVYYAYKCLFVKEGFADAVTVNGVDESNSINILAKIAKDLMDGAGLKVKGRLSTYGIDINGGGANIVNFNTGDAVNANSVRIWMDKGKLIFVGMNDAGTDYAWPGIVFDLKRQKIIAGGREL